MPSNYESTTSITRLAGADLSNSQYRFTKIDANGDAVLTGAGERAIGVTMGKAAAGRSLEVGIGGRLLVVCGGAVTAGQPVASDLNGAAVNQTSTNIVNGIALESGVAGEIVSLVFDPQGAP